MLGLLVMGLTSWVRPGKPVTNQVTTHPDPLRSVPDPARQRMWPDVGYRTCCYLADEIARHGMQEVSGSSPLSSTIFRACVRRK